MDLNRFPTYLKTFYFHLFERQSERKTDKTSNLLLAIALNHNCVIKRIIAEIIRSCFTKWQEANSHMIRWLK